MTQLKRIAMVIGLAAALVVPGAMAAELAEDIIYKATLGRTTDVAGLLEKGADPNTRDERGVPVISLAASRGDGEAMSMVKALVKAGADMNLAATDGDTPLMAAISQSNGPLVHYLISNGADFYAVNYRGQSVLEHAEWMGDPQVLSLVREAIQLDEEQFKDGRSKKRLYKRIDEYIYYNCAYQYLYFYRKSRQDPLNEAEFQAKLDKIQGHITEARGDLIATFQWNTRSLDNMGGDVRSAIHRQMDELITNRNRRKHGVGQDGDLDRRCREILVKWQKGFEKASRKAEQKQ